ncbi:MAG TPA: response regulator, partial [Thermoanaerobaculia bacterium]|nr:response regulator [Thermoanaerobaculia bacterium]
VLGHLFEPFSQAGRPSERGGLGLGLALVRSLVELHGGTVEAHSAGLGKGAEIILWLPLEATVPASADLAPAEPPQQERRRRCLLIEDNLDAAESMGLLLELSGHEVALAHDGPSGVEEALRFQPEVILCDIGLPGGMDGYAVARALRAEPGLEVAYLIALTGYGQEEDQRRAREAGFDAHMTKPADPDALRRLLQELPERTRESSNWDREHQRTENA